MIGEALIATIKGLISLTGRTVPDWTIQLACFLLLVGIILRYGKYLGKVLLIVLLLIIGSILFNALIV